VGIPGLQLKFALVKISNVILARIAWFAIMFFQLNSPEAAHQVRKISIHGGIVLLGIIHKRFRVGPQRKTAVQRAITYPGV
jgi:hypothetical protein